MKKDNPQLFDQILDNFGPMIARVCYIYGSDAENRKDLYQECLAAIWTGLRSYRGDSGLSTWLYRVCINTCISCFRRSSYTRQEVSLDDVLPMAAGVSDDGSDLAHAEALRDLYNLIGLLSTIDKAIIMMWLDEKSYDEIALVTGMPRNTIASRLHRIKNRLKELSNT